jgi:glycerol-3-phosphate acyltransferase PlsX
MKIALDAMGGDKAPVSIVDGAVESVREASGRFTVVLVGRQDEVDRYLGEKGYPRDHLELRNASEVIGMSESPATAIRRKRDSSIVVATGLHREGEVDAVVSAGNTGAAVASSLLSLGRIGGIDRPAIAIFYPSRNGGTVVLDGGANSDCLPKHLKQFALMGAACAEQFLGRNDPKIGLLSIGEEASKGNELTREAHALLSKSGLNFAGNVEGRDVIAGTVDVVVTDGFVGNVLLKFTESVIHYFNSLIREGIEKNIRAKLGAVLMRPVFGMVKKTLDYAEYGGMPLLGVDGVTIIGHGGSSSKAIKNAILAAERFVKIGVNEKIRTKMEELGS